jgi:hypothetical protein
VIYHPSFVKKKQEVQRGNGPPLRMGMVKTKTGRSIMQIPLQIRGLHAKICHCACFAVLRCFWTLRAGSRACAAPVQRCSRPPRDPAKPKEKEIHGRAQPRRGRAACCCVLNFEFLLSRAARRRPLGVQGSMASVIKAVRCVMPKRMFV